MLKHNTEARAHHGPAESTRVVAGSGGMILQPRGRWRLSVSSVPCFGQMRHGAYILDPETMELRDDADAVIARLVIKRLADEALACPPGNSCLPLVKVHSSEIMHEVQSPANADAFFVLPSQLNGVEYPDCNYVVSRIGSYKWDCTAGPRGQLAVHPAVGQFLLDNAACIGRKGGINAVSELLQAMTSEGHKLVMHNGYLMVPTMSREEASRAVCALERHLALLRTVAALDVPACGLSPDLAGWSAASHNVNLVYASAVPVGAYGNSGASYVQSISSLLLRGAYFGALRLALENHRARAFRPKTRVFLMPLGGGVFNNPIPEIARAVSEAVELAHGLCESPEELSERLDLRILTWCERASEAIGFRGALEDLNKLRRS